MITIATWNVNSVKARFAHLHEWLKTDSPDIVLLQELKCVDEAFPRMEIEDLGYNIATHGQKTYNGVAILSKFPLDDITRGLPGDDSDVQARYIEAVVSIPCHPERSGAEPKDLLKQKDPSATLGMTHQTLRIASVYVVNGQSVPSEKFDYKLRFLDRFHEHMKTLLGYGEMLVIGGDYNIAPTDADVHNPKEWEGSVLTHDEVRARWRKTINAGMADAQALMNDHSYSWWDYRTRAFERDDGLRIDHLLLSMQAAEKLAGCSVKKELRALEKASDHAPVVATFTL